MERLRWIKFWRNWRCFQPMSND